MIHSVSEFLQGLVKHIIKNKSQPNTRLSDVLQVRFVTRCKCFARIVSHSLLSNV